MNIVSQSIINHQAGDSYGFYGGVDCGEVALEHNTYRFFFKLSDDFFNE